MTFINTDGMSFFGPGSEWFWTMLRFTALAITFYAIYRQLRAQQVQVGENAKLLRSQAHYNALMLDQRPHVAPKWATRRSILPQRHRSAPPGKA